MPYPNGRPGWKLVEGLTERLELDSSGPWGSAAAAGNQTPWGCRPSASPRGRRGPPGTTDQRTWRSLMASSGPSPGLMFAEDGDAAQCGVEGERPLLALISEAAEEEAPKCGDLMERLRKAPGERNHSPHRRGAMRPDPQGFALRGHPPDVGKPARPDRGNFLPKERGPVHTQTGEPAAEDSKVPAFLQMEVITPLPTSPFSICWLRFLQRRSCLSSSPHDLGTPCAAQGPLWRTAPVFLRPCILQRGLEPEHRVEVAGTRQMEGAEPPSPAGSPECISEEAGVGVPCRGTRRCPLSRLGVKRAHWKISTQEASANRHARPWAETRRTGLETRAFAHELSSEASTGQAEQQWSKRF